MSDSERPELRAFRELEVLVGHLADELASFRRRALAAEARVRELEGATGGTAAAPELLEQLSSLERENGELRDRLDRASTRTRTMLDRVHFLRQQAQQPATGGGDR